MSIIRCILSLLILTFLATPLGAETRYVVEHAKAELRAGPGAKDKVLRSLTAGTPLKVLKKDDRRGYARVQLEGGQIGWVSLRQTSETVVAVPQNPTPEGPAPAPVKTAAEWQAELQHLQTELFAVRQASADILRIQAERDQLQDSVIALRKSLESALREKNALTDDQKQSWFLIGALVLFAGILLGVLLPRLSVRRRNHWSSF